MSVAERFEQVLRGVNYQALPLHHPTLHAYAQNVDTRPALIIRVDPEFDREIEGTRGIDIRLDPVSEPNRCLRFKSESNGLTVMFQAVVDSLLSASAEGGDESEALELLLSSYEELRLMFASRRDRLSESAVRGLFAELSMLLELRESGYSALSAIEAWHGPYRAAKDFLLPHARSIEVKSIRRTNHRVRIANVEQLNPRDEKLRLAVISLDGADPDVGIRLPDLVEEVREWTDSDPNARMSLTHAFDALGFDPSDEYYARWCFAASNWVWFEVSDDFPRVRAEMVPFGVTEVSFSIDTDQLREFETQPFWLEREQVQ